MDTIKLDTKGLDCPIPLMELKNALEGAEAGQVIEVEFTCPEATANIPNYCEENNIEILSFDKNANKSWTITVRK